MNLNQRIEQLEQIIKELQSKIIDLSSNVQEKTKSPYTISGGISSRGSQTPIDAKTGLGQVLGGHVIWNDSEVVAPLNEEPLLPDVGYNKHSHSRFSGGALIKDVLEIVEYDWNSVTPSIINKHSQQFFINQPAIKTELNTKEEAVKKIGTLDLVFNPDGGYDDLGNPKGTWGVATYEINVKKCYLIERDSEGNITLDSKGQQKKSLLYNADQNKTSVIWDESGNCWRFLAVYAEGN
jgi:hypothetical protein